MFKLVKKWQRYQRSNCKHPLDHQKGKRVPEKHLFLLYWLCQSFDGVDHNKLWKILKVKVKVKVKSLSRVRLFATPWTIAYQASPSLGFSRQEYWSGLPFPSPGDLPNPEIEPGSPVLQADALPSEPPGKSSPRKRNTKKKNVCLRRSYKSLRKEEKWKAKKKGKDTPIWMQSSRE